MAGQNLDQFETYFKRADLDGDGRISGAEAVAFFQGSGLPKQVLAQIWMHADQRNSGFLGRQEFYNALKLVTVAQSKRELTPDIVKAALYGPAAAKIPAPQINIPAVLAPQMGAVRPALSSPQMGVLRPALSSPQMGTVAPSVSASQIGAVSPGVVQNPGYGGLGIPIAGMHQLQSPSQINQSMRPPQGMPVVSPHPPQAVVPDLSRGVSSVSQVQYMPAATASRPSQPITSGPSSQSQNLSTGWLSGGLSSSTDPNALVPLTTSVAPNSQAMVSASSQATANESKALTNSGNGFASNSVFGGDAFSAAPSKPKQEPSKQAYSPSSSLPASSPIAPISGGDQSIFKSNSLDSLQSFSAMQSTGNQIPRANSSIDLGQQVSSQSSLLAVPSGGSTTVTNTVDDHSQSPWPKMKPSDVQKYTKVFLEVDADRDGKITGEQARNLFLSWRLPREVLKQVWDLSDQDSDSMLSLREFCFALYLMERYREGRPLPAMLPRSVTFDEALLSMTGQPNAAYGNPAWSPNPGFGQPQGVVTRPMTPSTGFRPQVPSNASHTSANVITNQSKSREPVFDDSFSNQVGSDDQRAVNSKVQDEMVDEKKVEMTENVILDSKEKIDFYRSKMQELVLYKSRCDNKLNEITERAIADKREAEMLGKKYEEKYKQVAEIASKLTIEEAKFREIQERKRELGQAIINVERGGSADGILQVRSDRIQSDLEELMKVLTEVCKKHGQEIKSSAVIELPIGWQPGISEGAGIWDEDWDKFEDNGFGNELTFDTKGVAPSPKPDSATLQHDGASLDGSFSPNSSVADDKHRNVFGTNEHPPEGESVYSHSEDESARSPHGSPAGRTSEESPSRQNFDSPFRSNELEAGTGRSFDDSTWGAFDNDDTDSVWGFNPAKDTDSDKHRDYFGSSVFDTSSMRADSPSAESVFNKKMPFTFEDSVPSSPQSRFGSSPPRFSDVSRDQYDSFSRFDSFNTHESGFSHQPDRITRFDSMSSTKDYGHGLSFDDNDPFGSSVPFKVSSENQTPKKGSDNWSPF